MKLVMLGGADCVGASCYYLKYKEANIIFDCGIGFNEGNIYHADYNSLIRNGFIEDFSQITHIFISHGHLDHIGHLADFYKLCTRAKIYSTYLTKVFVKHQLWDNNNIIMSLNSEMAVLNLLDHIITIGYNERIKIPEYDFEFKFFDAGHIPGAAMIYLKTKEGTLLYTGDFSYKRTGLVSGYCLPSDLRADTLLMCGLHSRTSSRNSSNYLVSLLNNIIYSVHVRKKVNLYTHQLTKGIEILKILLIKRKETGIDFKIAISEEIYKLAEEVEKSGYSLIKNGVFLKNDRNSYDISISTAKKDFDSQLVDFSIHADFDELADFIEKLDPTRVFIVHVGNNTNFSANPIGEEMVSRGRFIDVTYTEENETYVI